MTLASTIKDTMKRNIVVVRPEDSIKEAVRNMASKNIGCLVVVDKNKPVGIMTERDVIKRIMANGVDTEKTRIKEVMTRKIISLSSDRSIKEAVDILDKNKIKKLPVIEHGKLIGIVTMTDLLRCISRIEKKESKELRNSIKKLHLTKIRLQTRIIKLEDKITKSKG